MMSEKSINQRNHVSYHIEIWNPPLVPHLYKIHRTKRQVATLLHTAMWPTNVEALHLGQWEEMDDLWLCCDVAYATCIYIYTHITHRWYIINYARVGFQGTDPSKKVAHRIIGVILSSIETRGFRIPHVKNPPCGYWCVHQATMFSNMVPCGFDVAFMWCLCGVSCRLSLASILQRWNLGRLVSTFWVTPAPTPLTILRLHSSRRRKRGEPKMETFFGRTVKNGGI